MRGQNGADITLPKLGPKNSLSSLVKWRWK